MDRSRYSVPGYYYGVPGYYYGVPGYYDLPGYKGTPSGYDDTQSYDLPQSEEEFDSARPHGYTRRPDKQVREEVESRLAFSMKKWSFSTSEASGISVDVKNGKAILTGHVENHGIRRMVEDIVMSVPSVREVDNRIQIAP